MIDERNIVRYVSWRDLFPWLLILRTFRIAIAPSLLALASVATLLVPVGDFAAGWLFLPKVETEGFWRVQYPAPRAVNYLRLPDAAREYLPSALNGVTETYQELVEPAERLFHLDLTIRETAYYLFRLLWTLAVWAFFGGAITRLAVVRLATEDSPPLLGSLRFAARRYLWYLLAPLYPLLGIVLLALPVALLGLVLWLPEGIGAVVVGLAWIFVLVASLAAAWLVGGLIFGWPLMWPAISAERDGDPFDAFSRSFSYVYGRPLHYFFYVVLAALFGALCLAVLQGAAHLVTEFGFWALSWGAGENAEILRRNVAILQAGGMQEFSGPRAAWIGAAILAWVLSLVRLVATGYTFSFFWTTFSAIYLLLRLDRDEQEIDEVYLEAVTDSPPIGTPPPQSPPAETAPAAVTVPSEPPPLGP